MYRTKVFPLGEVTFNQIDAELAKQAGEGFGIVTGPVYLPVLDTPGALIYTLADLREPVSKELPKPEIIPSDPNEEAEGAEAANIFEARRNSQGA